ncbi:MAG TPA: alpha/beta hydrolase, partial [Bacteroidia bacterium]
TGNKTASFEKNIKEQLLSSDGNTRISLLKSIGEGKQKDELGIIKNTKLPTAVIHGENDALVNYNYLANVSYGNLWQNKIHIVPGSGHFPQMEQAEAFAKLLMDFHKHCSNE